jgi:tetratricopeptide (TPR) repeat protein
MRTSPVAVAVMFGAFVFVHAAPAQTPQADSLRSAQRLDADGKHREARVIFEALIASAPDAAARAAVLRRLAMSYGYDGNCGKVIELEEQVIAYWVTRRQAEPQNAHYQEGEMANEAARVCIDNGFLDDAERMYRRGTALGNDEPGPRTHPKSLWDFRLAHALGRIAARRGNAAEANRWVVEARRILDADRTMAKGQEQFYPYLVGYVALFTNTVAVAESAFTITTKTMPGDPFQFVLLGMTMEKKGDKAQERELFQRAYDMSTASTPSSIYSRVFTKRKLASP